MKRFLLGLLCVVSFSMSANLQADQKISQQDQQVAVDLVGLMQVAVVQAVQVDLLVHLVQMVLLVVMAQVHQ